MTRNTVSAPELRVAHWIDGQGQPMAPLRLADLGTGFKLIYCFQHWCEGCHAHGFPALLRLVQALEPKGVGFAVVQTVFEGFEINTPERRRETQQRYGLTLPFGHDSVDQAYPTVMQDYGTGGTPWFIVIDPQGQVVHSDFSLDAERLIQALPGTADGPMDAP